MTFWKSRYSKNGKYEMYRFATKKNKIVIWWAYKLFKKFTLSFLWKWEKVVTYADLRYATWAVYEKLWFKYSHKLNPNFFYFKKWKYELKSRLQFQKHKLKDLFENYNEKLTASENMYTNWYRRIWDCWNKVYIYEKK